MPRSDDRHINKLRPPAPVPGSWAPSFGQSADEVEGVGSRVRDALHVGVGVLKVDGGHIDRALAADIHQFCSDRVECGFSCALITRRCRMSLNSTTV